jgi:enamine deaminase RidA (YjgF/YER057c/UK114 family)
MERDYPEPLELAPPPEPYSHVVRCGDTVYIAGQVAFDQENRIVGVGDPHRQAEQTWANIERAARAAGSSLADVVKITVFVKDIRDAKAEVEVRQGLFEQGRFPVCTQVQVANLGLPELLMEVDAVAVIDAGQ